MLFNFIIYRHFSNLMRLTHAKQSNPTKFKHDADFSFTGLRPIEIKNYKMNHPVVEANVKMNQKNV